MRIHPGFFIPGQYVLQVLESGLLSAPARDRVLARIAAAGHTTDSLAQQGVKAPLCWLVEALEEQTLDAVAEFAWRFGANVRLTSHGGLSMMLMSSSSVREAISALRFLPLLTNLVSVSLVEAADGGGFLLIEAHAGEARLDTMPLYYAASAMRRLIRMVTGRQPTTITHIPGPAPSFVRSEDPALWRFDAAAAGIEFSQEELDQACLFADPVTFHATWQACAADLQVVLQGLGLAQRVRRLLDDSAHYPNQTALARSLHMSSSTLKRQLAQAGSSFSQLLEDSRRQRAIAALLVGQLSVQQISERLGYSDQANFTHAFKKWTGVTPGAFSRAGR